MIDHEIVNIQITKLESWLKEETTSIIEPLDVEAGKLLDDIKPRIFDFIEACDRMSMDAEKEIAKNGRKTSRRAKVTLKLAKNFSKIIKEVAIPNEVSYQSFDLLVDGFENALEEIKKERRRWFPLISPYFIFTRRRFDVSLRKVEEKIEEMRSYLTTSYSKAEAVEDAISKIRELHNSHKEFVEIEAKKKETETMREVMEKEIHEVQQEIASIQSKNGIIELREINKEIAELQVKLKRKIRYLKKPLVKFQNLAQGSGYSLPPDQTKKLKEYLTDSFETIATEEEGYPILKKILLTIEKALNQGELKLKSSRLRKAKSEIDNILRGSLDTLSQKCKETYFRKKKLRDSGTLAKSKNRAKELQEKLRELQRQKKGAESRAIIQDNEINERTKKTLEAKRNLEEIVSGLTNKNVRVII